MTLRKRTDAGTYQSVVRIPVDLAASYGKSHIQRSLNTSDRREASRLDKIHEGECQVGFERKRAELRGEASLSPAVLTTLARYAVDAYRLQQWGDPFDSDSDDYDPPGGMDLADELAKVGLIHAPAAASVYVADHAPAMNAVDQRRFHNAVIKAYEYAVQTEMRDVGLAYVAPPVDPMPKEDEFGAPAYNADDKYNLGSEGAIALDDACALLKATKWWTNEISPKSRLHYAPTLDLLCGLFDKGRLMHTFTPTDMAWLAGIVDTLPVNLPHTGDIHDHLRKAAKAQCETIAAASKNKHRTIIRRLFGHLTKAWYLKVDVSASLPSWSKGDRKKVRVQFTDDELTTIMRKLTADPDAAEMYWIPLLACHTGARRGELCQLGPEDVAPHEGVWCLHIWENDEGQRLKTEASKRIVPLHSSLIALGFLEFVALNRENRNGRIWGHLHHNVHGWGDGFGKRFGRLTKGLFAERPGTIKDFHSFRHTVKAGLEPHVDYGVLDALIGWSSEERRVLERSHARRKHTRDGYGTDRPIDRLKAAVELLQYPWMNELLTKNDRLHSTDGTATRPTTGDGPARTGLRQIPCLASSEPTVAED
jgi:integrase